MHKHIQTQIVIVKVKTKQNKKSVKSSSPLRQSICTGVFLHRLHIMESALMSDTSFHMYFIYFWYVFAFSFKLQYSYHNVRICHCVPLTTMFVWLIYHTHQTVWMFDKSNSLKWNADVFARCLRLRPKCEIWPVVVKLGNPEWKDLSLKVCICQLRW